MSIVRLYTGDDGKTHMEEMTLESHPELASMHNVTSAQFRSSPAGYFSDWHTAPRRQYVVTLSGEVEIGLEDGTVKRFGPGHVTIAEDTTGNGHTTRVVGDQPRVSMTIPLGD